MTKKTTLSQGARLERVRASTQFEGNTFKNPTGKGPGLKDLQPRAARLG
jgi:hypothetical protein